EATSGRLRWRKSGLAQMVYQVAYSPDGRHLVSAGGTWAHPGKGELQVWDAATGETVRRFPVVEAAPILAIAFSPDGRHLATSGLDNTVRVWDFAGGHEIHPSVYQVARRSMTFSPDGRFLVSGGDDGVRVQQSAGGTEVRHFPRLGALPAFSPDGKRMATAAANQVKVWDVSRLETAGEAGPLLVQSFSGHEGDILSLAFHPDGQAVASTGTDGTVRLWDLSGRQETVVFRGHEGRVAAAGFQPGGRCLATGGPQPGDVKGWGLTRAGGSTEARSF